MRANDAGTDFTLRLEAQAPFPVGTLLQFLHVRAVAGVEDISAQHYRRWVRIGEAAGWLHVEPDRDRTGIAVSLDDALLPHLAEIVARLRHLFDLDACPEQIDAALARDPRLAPHVARLPGLRVPGTFDGWELAVRAILGQQVSVRAATTLSQRLVHRFGQARQTGRAAAQPIWEFPSAQALATQSAERVAAIGLPRARAQTIVELARGVEASAIDLSPRADVSTTVTALRAVRGIGSWTAHYVAMRALRAPDLFLADDLAVKKALGCTNARAAEAASLAWRPWRAYAVMHLWNSLAQGG